MPDNYRSLCAALTGLDTLPEGPARARAVEELRASLRGLTAAEVGRLFAEIQRAALARHAREDGEVLPQPGT
ncbi:MAG TPA: hypothetical protein VFX49_07030 [Chloroflexota bacterium]|nr:hypothetical protein [Chloroflexota bacterium]